MSARPESSAFRAFLERASRRQAWLSAAEGATAGFVAASVFALVGWPSRSASAAIATGVVLGAIGVATSLLFSRTKRTRVAYIVERRAPECRNLVITADELPAHRVNDSVASLIHAQATSLVQRIELSKLFPARNRATAFVTAAVLWGLAVTRTATAPAAVESQTSRGTSVAVSGIDITVVPPKYASRPEQTLRDPARIEALAGSQLRVSIRAQAARVAVLTLHSTDTINANAGTFTTATTADADGYIAIEPLGADGRAGPRRLIGLSVLSDAAPRVRIPTPGRDVYFDNARKTIDIAVEANDDIGLASLRLRYTKVSGSGERFTFTEGEVPINVARRDDRTWTARVAWRLDSLDLGPGDMVVYRAVAADHRPGAAPSESDSYIAEFTAPGGVAAAGFALDPEQERYAVSQQMVILKTERLSARKATMPAEEYALAAAEIAAEQRKVRAEFVFMMGGELADAPDVNADMTMLNEEAEAEGESDLAAGRNLTQGRIALLSAIRSMSRAAASLTDVDLTTALMHERAALVQLERAFARTRIILRALTQRERLDLSRRLSGALIDAARDARPQPEPELDTRAIALRRALADVAALAGSSFTDSSAFRATALAERVLRVDPSSKQLQDVAAQLTSAASAIARNRREEARDLLDRAATGIAAAARAEMLSAPRAGSTSDLDRLGGALTDVLRGRGGTR